MFDIWQRKYDCIFIVSWTPSWKYPHNLKPKKFQASLWYQYIIIFLIILWQKDLHHSSFLCCLEFMLGFIGLIGKAKPIGSYIETSSLWEEYFMFMVQWALPIKILYNIKYCYDLVNKFCTNFAVVTNSAILSVGKTN